QLRTTLLEEAIGDIIKKKAAKYWGLPLQEISSVKVLRKSLDARKSTIYFNYKVAVYINETDPGSKAYNFDYKDVSKAKKIHIIGFGPAGMYAAMRCIELGYRPIVLERGKNVQDRRRDLRPLTGTISLTRIPTIALAREVPAPI